MEHGFRSFDRGLWIHLQFFRSVRGEYCDAPRSWLANLRLMVRPADEEAKGRLEGDFLQTALRLDALDGVGQSRRLDLDVWRGALLPLPLCPQQARSLLRLANRSHVVRARPGEMQRLHIQAAGLPAKEREVWQGDDERGSAPCAGCRHPARACLQRIYHVDQLARRRGSHTRLHMDHRLAPELRHQRHRARKNHDIVARSVLPNVDSKVSDTDLLF
mmetsp:Transcript_23563/g.66647  ORF Transcript_23563/g.66647 Transcript_23563/m.66647 type:complete len:217 (-) Transcript_23563:597-1247(-)